VAPGAHEAWMELALGLAREAASRGDADELAAAAQRLFRVEPEAAEEPAPAGVGVESPEARSPAAR